ncbi:uncharacterized protein [Watersipora subatra]|uniref:uncharacterized protein n=1 Tax=Watersipora subatra TaxID=2589382 RepID=UPI00355BE92A
MPKPMDKQGIQRLLGSLNYLRGFIPNISEVTEPLRALLKADTFQRIDVQTDHNPLVSIIKKDLHKSSPRLQRLLLRLFKNEIRRVTDVPEKFLYLADTLSRAYLANEYGELEEEVVMLHTIQIQDEAKDQLTMAYEIDPVRQELRNAILKGWAWGNKTAFPIHQGHLGTQKCIDRACQSLYWPRLASEIKETVARCSIYQRHANQQQQEPLIPHDVPELPWNKVGIDIMDFRNKSYLIVVDFYSYYLEIRLISHKKSEDVVATLKSIFAVYGVPVEVIAENMPFSSYAMRNFASEWEFNINTSSSHYAKSNCMAERYVQTTKQLRKKLVPAVTYMLLF